ncbi:MAG: hypothetical protein ACM357_10115 [Gemmatimonadota bacterium]
MGERSARQAARDEFEKTASLLRGISVTEQLKTRIAEVRQLV